MKGEQGCFENKFVLTVTWERLKDGCTVGWGSVVPPLGWLSRGKEGKDLNGG